MNPLRLASILFTLTALTVTFGMPSFWRAVATTEPTIHKAIQPIAATASTLTKADPATQARVNESYGKLPLSFEANHGQTDERVKFLSRGPGYKLFLTSTKQCSPLRHRSARIDGHRNIQAPSPLLRQTLRRVHPQEMK